MTPSGDLDSQRQQDINTFKLPLSELPKVLHIPTLYRLEQDSIASSGGQVAVSHPERLGGSVFNVQVRPPGSKSLTNRALLLASLCEGESTLHGALLDADDAQQMLGAIERLGASVIRTGDDLRVRGVGGCWKPRNEINANKTEIHLNLNNAGTAVRFLAGASLLSPVPLVIDGNARMRQRPIAELSELLTKLGCVVEHIGDPGSQGPPVRLTPPADLDKIPTTIEVGKTLSSQFVSALLLVAPWLPHGLTLRMTESPTSASYISMTASLIANLGGTVQLSADGRVIRIRGEGDKQGLKGFEYRVEPDASGATYFWAAAAIAPRSTCTVLGLDDESLQGDSQFPEFLRRMGAIVQDLSGELQAGTLQPVPKGIQVTGPIELKPILADMSDMPDAAMTLASVACFAKGTSILRGLKTLRVKETDRIWAVATELRKIGVEVQTAAAGDPDVLTITPPKDGVDCSFNVPRVEFDTYDDHRMAMSLSLIGLRRPNVYIREPQCVAKTYPGYWAELARIYPSP